MLESTKTPGVDNQEWAQATAKAKEVAASMRGMASHAAMAASEIANQAIRDVSHKADEVTANAGHRIQEFSETLSDNMPNEGVLGTTSQSVVDAIKESGEYLQGAKLSGMTEDFAQLIRRYPIPAVLIAISLGWFAGRKGRS